MSDTQAPVAASTPISDLQVPAAAEQTPRQSGQELEPGEGLWRGEVPVLDHTALGTARQVDLGREGDTRPCPCLSRERSARTRRRCEKSVGGLTDPVSATVSLVRLGAPEDEPECVLQHIRVSSIRHQVRSRCIQASMLNYQKSIRKSKKILEKHTVLIRC